MPTAARVSFKPLLENHPLYHGLVSAEGHPNPDLVTPLPLVWLFNVVGTVDLIYAVTRRTLEQAAPGMGAAWHIPTFLVPALLVSHFLVFKLLLGPRR